MDNILLILSSTETINLLDQKILTPAGFAVSFVDHWEEAVKVLKNNPPSLIIMSSKFEGRDYSEYTPTLFKHYPIIPIILLAEIRTENLAIEAFRRGFADYLQLPIDGSEVLSAVERALKWRQRFEEQVRLAANHDNKSLRTRMDMLETIQRVGRTVTSSLDLDGVLTSVVDATVDLTGAEEGSLLLLDETTGELYMRASRNFQEEFANSFRLPVQDSLAGQVIKTGNPLLINEKAPRKIKTAYLVHALIYVPLIVQNRVIGVLGVDNRNKSQHFSESQIAQVSALADYAAIAIENARLYTRSEFERNQLETILKDIEEGVIVVDHDRRLVLINRKASEAFGVDGRNLVGKRIRDVIDHQELLEIFRENNHAASSHAEISLEDGRIFNAQLTSIPEVGLVVTMQDITHLKELDRIKTDFVNTVSHDLRSPLTAILGYVELIDRAGPVTEQQKEFIDRVQISVHNITSLINDLLELGRIEAGFDSRKEIISFSAIIQYAVDSLVSRAVEKNQTLTISFPDGMPLVLGNPVRLRQMISNLIANAIKFTQAEGEILVSAHSEGEQIILQVSDNGPGIPPADQPYIFDKFYRASNVHSYSPGTGLGLAIVKSIVDYHLGRIWVDSTIGQGTTFTVVLPVVEKDL